MRKGSLFMSSLLVAGLLSGCGNNNQGQSAKEEASCGTPVLTKMKCEFVPDKEEAVIYGQCLGGAKVLFPGDLEATVVADKSNDSALTVVVPEGTRDGQIKVTTASGEAISSFFFRDNRNIIVNFDRRLATWGGFNPYDEADELITATIDGPFPNGAKLIEGCSGNYGLLYGEYKTPWTMYQCCHIQYVANPYEGGRGQVSVAGASFEAYDLADLALKFEVYVPKEAAYKGVRTEIFFGPIDAPDKHGRGLMPLCIWKPYEATGSFYTDGWETITIPLSEFKHTITSDDDEFTGDFDIRKATNFSFLQFGAPEGEGTPLVFMCVDNFRIVPLK